MKLRNISYSTCILHPVLDMLLTSVMRSHDNSLWMLLQNKDASVIVHFHCTLIQLLNIHKFCCILYLSSPYLLTISISRQNTYTYAKVFKGCGHGTVVKSTCSSCKGQRSVLITFNSRLGGFDTFLPSVSTHEYESHTDNRTHACR